MPAFYNSKYYQLYKLKDFEVTANLNINYLNIRIR